MSIEELRRWANEILEKAVDGAEEVHEFDEELYDQLADIAVAAENIVAMCDEQEPAELDFG